MVRYLLQSRAVVFTALIIATGVFGEATDVIKNHPNCRPSQQIQYFADRDNCSSYYSCVDRDAYRLICPNDLEYNSAAMICDYKGDAGCSIIPNFEECRGGNEIVPDPHDCRGYYLCEMGTAYKHYCPEGLEYNAEAQLCDYPDRASCSYIFKYPKCEVGKEYFEPHPKDCSAYYVCRVNGDAVRTNCPDGFLFSKAKQLCDYPENVSC